MSLSEIAMAVSSNGQPNVRRLFTTLELLVAARLLKKDAVERYAIAPEAQREGPELGLNEGLVARLLDARYLWECASSTAYFDNLDYDQRLGFAETMESQLLAPADALRRQLAALRYKLAIDIGSGTGLLARRLVAAGIAKSAICLEADDFARHAGAAGAREEGIASAVRFCSFDLRSDPLPQGDLFLLSRVLHDWSDTVCADLLKRVAAAMGRRALLVVHEEFRDRKQIWPAALDFFLASSLGDGRVRTESELRGLLDSAGLVVTRVNEVDDCTALLFAELDRND